MHGIFSYGGAASDTTIQAKERGLSDGQALALGVIAGASEAITEKIGMDALMNVKGAKSWKQYIVRNARAEAGEEGISNVANFLGDIIVAGDESEFQKNIEYYVKEKGLKENEAFGRAVGDQLLSMGLDSLSGFLTGGVLSGATAIVGSAAQTRANRAEENEMVRGMQEWLTERKTNLENTKQFSVVGATEDGRKIYKTNYPKGTPKAVKQNDVIQMVQNIWSKKPIELTIMNEETGEAEIITANFDPELSERSDLAKIVYGIKRGTASEKRMTLDLAPDFYQIAQDAKHTGGKIETGKITPAHEGVKRWEYFVTNLVYEGEDGVQIDAHMNIDVKRKDNGDYFYSFVIEKGTAPQKIRSVADENVSPTVPNDSIPQTVSLSQENKNKSFAITRTLPRAGENGPVLPTAKEEMEARMRQRRAAEAKTETERTGILYGATEENIGMAVRISEAINREVVFYENTDPNVKNDDGYYNSRDGKIYINAKSENAIPRIIAHEMTHSVELADSYIDLFRTTIRHIQKSGKSISDMRSEIKSRYARNGVQLSRTAQIDAEIMAEYIAEHLLSAEASITSLAKENPKGASAILRFLDNLLAKLGNTKAQERVFVERARSLYAKALGETAGRKEQQAWQSTVEAERQKMQTPAGRVEPTSETTEGKHPIIRENVLPTATERFGNKTAEVQNGRQPATSTTENGMAEDTETTRKAESRGAEGMAEVEAIVSENLRPEITENAELMELLRDKFGADGTAALAGQIKAEVGRTGTVGRFGVLFSDGGRAVEEALAAEGNVQYSIGKTKDNNLFVTVEKDILKGVPKKKWVKTVEENLRDKFPQGITVRNDTIKVTARTTAEITRSKYTEWLLDNSPEIYKDKLRSTNNADEILEATYGWTGEALKHPRKDNIKEFARGNVLMRVGENDYQAEVVVGSIPNGNMLLYDIVNIQPTKIQEKNRMQTDATSTNEKSVRSSASDSDISISEIMENVNTLDENIQYAITKDPVDTETTTESAETTENADFWDEWLEKVREYGAMEKGEKPTRDIEVPKKIGKNKPVSQTVRIILETKVTPDEAYGDDGGVFKDIKEKERRYEALLGNLSSGALSAEVLAAAGARVQNLREEIESLMTMELPKEFTAPIVQSWIKK